MTSIEKDKNELFPVFLKLNNLAVLIIGGGKVGLEKLTAILSNSPKSKVTIVSESFIVELIQYVESFTNVEIIKDTFKADYLEGKQVVVSAINDIDTALQIKKIVNEKGLLFNSADKPDLCDFYLGSTVTKGNLKIGISTNGKSPTVAKRLKEIFNENIPEEIDNSLIHFQI